MELAMNRIIMNCEKHKHNLNPTDWEIIKNKVEEDNDIYSLAYKDRYFVIDKNHNHIHEICHMIKDGETSWRIME